MQEHEEQEEISAEAESVTPEEVVAESATAQPVAEKDDYSAEELAKAEAQGYNINDPKGFSPGEFNRRGPLYEEKRQLKAEKAKLSRQNEAMERRLAKVEREAAEARELGYQQALADLNAQRLAAVEYGDKQAFEAADKKYQEVQQEYSRPKEDPILQDPDAIDFMERNKDWIYSVDGTGRAILDTAVVAIGQINAARIAKGLRPMSVKEEVSEAEKYLRIRFPEKFSNPAKSKPVAVAPSTSTSVRTEPDELTESDLTPGQLAALNRLREHDPKFTVQRYVDLLNYRPPRGN